MLPIEIQKYFEKRSIEYELIKFQPQLSLAKAVVALDIDPSRVAVANIMRDAKGSLMVIYPLNGVLDIDKLNENLDRKLVTLSADEIRMEWPVYMKDQVLPLALAYQIGAEVHDSFACSKPVYFQVSEDELCMVGGGNFCLLQGPAMYDAFFVNMPGEAGPEEDDSLYQTGRKEQIRDRLKSLDSLPAMPTIAQRLLQLNANPYASARDLGEIVETDPSLAAQLIRFARSPLYGYSGELNSLQDVISRVLGYDMVMDMALGVSVGKVFKNPRSGKLGLTEFWRHATYSAVLCQKLCKAVSAKVQVRPGMAYLCGLLHNIGFLLLGHMFPQDFALLNKAATKYKESPVIELENTMIGVTHMELGVWLMQAWNMPEELIIAIREHHNEHYHDAHSAYANLILVANRMLSEMEIGEELSDQLPQSVLSALGLEEDRAREIYESLMSSGQGLDYMAVQMAA